MKISSMLAWAVALTAGVAALQPALAQTDDAAAGRAREAQLGDPYVPPAARKATAGTDTSGAALRAQVARKLQSQFNDAAAQRNGTLTQEQARAAGLGYVANNFRQIDANRAGRVSFDDVQRYMQSQSAMQNR
ncbi:EF-hand domain-containing protein [Burkholderia alba]|uniref:EF-hand domain-containing protein n=1 Tax=Burkholderia alba TaxID=2683677 RepID=UPI002B0558C6|nr:EF-hand domain-containing protein [Burkholderia alba]